jgi:hypothetical protein
MPWNSKVLQSGYSRLPKDIDIVVHCASGVRGALASAFLDSLGFKRIFNMTGGFNKKNPAGSFPFVMASGYYIIATHQAWRLYTSPRSIIPSFQIGP